MRTLVSRARDFWDRFWFEPEPAANLAAARILVCVHSIWILLSRDFAGISDIAFLWTMTPPEALWRFLVVPGHGSIEGWLQLAALVSLVLALVGLYPRAMCFFAGLLIYHLSGFETVFRGSPPEGRGLSIAPVALLLLAASPSADALVPFRRRSRSGASPDYGWSLKVIQLLICQIYLFSALGKLVATGWSWGSAASMRRWLLWANGDPTASTFTEPGLWLADQPPFLLGILGLGTLVIELGFISILFARRLRAWVIPVTLAFHVIMLFTINAHVPEVWLILVFVDWEGLRRRVRARGVAGSVAPDALASP